MSFFNRFTGLQPLGLSGLTPLRFVGADAPPVRRRYAPPVVSYGTSRLIVVSCRVLRTLL
ncbi:MAG: hypothetical protein ACLFMU_08395, partial [Bacteroidales bacterium]